MTIKYILEAPFCKEISILKDVTVFFEMILWKEKGVTLEN